MNEVPYMQVMRRILLKLTKQIIGISETWLKPFYTNYIIPNYNIDKDIRVNNCGGVYVYIFTVVSNTIFEIL